MELKKKKNQFDTDKKNIPGIYWQQGHKILVLSALLGSDLLNVINWCQDKACRKKANWSMKHHNFWHKQDYQG